MLKCIHSVLLYVRDVQASLAYYRDKLGFQVGFQSDEEGGVVGLRLGEFSLILHSDQGVQPEYLLPSGERGRGVILHFEVENVDLYHDTLKEKGVAISKRPEDQSFGLRTMYVYDPDGYNLCFVQRLPRG
ncbi:MAG: VOC family protein [Candidatus Bipolaricaulota bacterium]|nr:VOC family protein [Candidatus Bipolaricaulota bacterium]